MFTLYAISPKLTVLMVTVIPAVIGVGTMMGSGLRALSKAAQDQVCVNHGLITKGTAVSKQTNCHNALTRLIQFVCLTDASY